MNNIKKLWAEYEKAEIKSSELYAKLEADPENEKIETAWDQAYEKEFAAHEALVNGIVNITGGQIEAKIARAMIATKRDQLKNLISRLA